MSKNLIASKTKKSDKIYTMAKPEFAFTGSKNMFKGVEPQGDYTNISKTANINMTINPAQFYSPELTPETWLLPKSRLEILKWPLLAGELVFGNNRFLPIEDLKIGDYVLSKNGTYQKVVGVMSKDPDSTGVAITARYCPTVQFGGNHPILAIDTDKGSASKTDIYRKSLYAGFIKFETESKWYAAKDIKPGFIVAVPKFKVEKTPTIDLAPYVPQCQHGYKYEIQDNIIKVKSFGNINFDMPRFLPLEEDLFTFLGWYVAEGHIHNATILTCCFDEEDVIKSLQETLNTYLHIPFEKMPCKPHNGSLRLIIYNKILNNFLEDSFNTGARNKDIPQWLLEAPINLVQAFLRGWIKGDGYIKPMSGTKSRGFSVCTVSEQLALKGHMLFNKVGAIATFRKREQSIEKISGSIKGKVKSVAPFTYTLEVGGQRLKKVFPDFETYEKGCPNYFEDENFFYTSVTNVELFDTDKKFYCITTEDHTIQVPFVTHNCRIYFNLDPYIQSILTMHSQYPISEFRLQHKDKETEDFFNRKMFEDCHIDWVSFLERLALSYYVFGEGICWGAWNSIKGTWDDLILIDPALIDYQEDALTGKSIMSLIPTQELKQLVAQSLKEGSTDLPADYIACVQDNKQIPLDTEGVEPNYLTGRKYVPPTAFMFSRLLSPGSTRGVPIIQQLFKCVTGDTKVALLDGTNPTIKELAESGRKDFWVYGADKDGNIVPAKAECAAYIKDEETVEVLLDNGSKIRCTKDHPFFLRDMTRVEAKDLKPGDILKGRIKDSKVVSVTYTGKVEPVYCVANAGVNHNFMIAFDDGSGVLSGNTLIYQDKIRLAQVACLSGDTRIPLLDGTKPTVEYLYKSGRTNFEVYSCNDKGEVVIRRANKVVCNGKKQLYKITLDDGSFIRLTEDHPCMMRDGSFKEVKDLTVGDSLMPFYTRKATMPHSSDYEQVYVPGLDTWKFTHRLHFTDQERKGFVVHHKNFNRFDNTYGNLQLVPFKEHGKMHRELLAKNQDKMQERFAEVRKTEEYKKLMRETGKKISNTKKAQHKADYLNGVRYKIMTSLPECGFTVIEYETKPYTNVKTAFEHVSKVFNLGVKVRTFNNKALIYKESIKDTPEFKKVLNELVHELQYTTTVKNTMSEEFKDFLRKYDSLKNKKVDFLIIDTPNEVKTCNIGTNIARRIKSDGLSNIRVARLLGYQCVLVYNDYAQDVIDLIKTESRKYANRIKTGKDNIWNHKVVSIEQDAIEDVYDIQSVEGTHTFAALTTDDNGIFIHNCADSFYNPIQLWTIGSFTGDPKTSVIPTEADLQQYRDMIQQATMTPPFSIYVPPFVKYEALGVQGKLLSVYEDLGYVENCIFVGLGVNKNLVLGSGPSFSSGKQISLYRLIKMYKSFRLKLEAFIKKYIILPIAKAADIRDEHSNYIIPDIKWAESLQPEQDKDLFDSLFKLYDKGLVSTQTLMEHFMIPLDMKLESERLLAERLTVFDKATDRLGGKVFREDMKNLDKSKLGGSSSPKMSDSLSGGSSGAGPSAGGEKPEGGAPGTAESDKSYLPPPISGGPEEAKETPAE